MPEQVAFLGLGAMGFGMATNLLNTHSKAYSVTGFDIWGPTLSRFSAQGGSIATTPRETVKGAKYVALMVATAAQVNDALFGVAPGTEGAAFEVLEQGAVLLLLSTGPPGYTLDLQQKLADHGRSDVLLIDAPVSGGTARAANGTLTILASGTEEALQAGSGLLNAMSGGLASEGKGNLWIIEGGLGKGTEVKMVHQVLAAIGTLLASEALGFVARLGLNTKTAFDAINKSDAWNWMVENRGSHLFETEDKVYSALNIMVKDIGIVMAGSRLNDLPMLLSSTTEQILFTGVAAGNGLLDDSKLIRVYSPQQPNIVLESSTRSTANDEAKLELVKKFVKAVNLAAAAEGLSLGKRVGLSQQQLYDIIKGAAGGSWVFQNRVPDLISSGWKQSQSGKTVSQVVKDLKEVIQVAHDLKYPLHLGAATLQLFQLAEFRGLGSEDELAISKTWEA